MYGERIDLINIKTEIAICKIIRKYLSEKQINDNYLMACQKYSSTQIINQEKIVKECRIKALKQVPREEFTPFQIMYIRKVWEITEFLEND